MNTLLKDEFDHQIQAIATMPWAPFWSVLFFLMLMTLGLDSSVSLLNAKHKFAS